MIWTDTFANNQQSNIFSTELGENNARLAELNRQDIRVIIGNPPYSAKQDNANDDNQNERYEELDDRISETYAAGTDAVNKNSLYDSYIRAYRWASDRIGDKGIIGFVTNAGWIDSNSADGMRKSLAEEFNSIYIYHLKGNARTQGEQRRKEKENIFGEGSKAAVAVVFLIKNPDSAEHGKIYFHAVGDYLSRAEKLACLQQDRSMVYTQTNVLVPDVHGDWLNQRDDSYAKFMRVDGKKTTEVSIFDTNYSNGLKTNCDAWCYSSSKDSLTLNIQKYINTYNNEVQRWLKSDRTEKIENFVKKDPRNVSWHSGILPKVKQGIIGKFDESSIYYGIYRPFIGSFVYFNRLVNQRVAKLPQFFPTNKVRNLVICSSGVGSKEFSCLRELP